MFISIFHRTVRFLSSMLLHNPGPENRELQVLPLRFISRRWGEITSVELPLWLRPYVYNGWARAFHSNLEEASRPIEEYPSLRAFFTRKLKDGARPLEIGPANLISPVDGVVIGCGQVKGPGAMIEQVIELVSSDAYNVHGSLCSRLLVFVRSAY